MSKHKKWESEWNTKIQQLTCKKGKITIKEKQADGSFKDVEKEVDNITKHYFDEREKLLQAVEDKKAEFKKKGGYSDRYADLALAYDELEEKINDWKEHLKNTLASGGVGVSKNYTLQHQQFLLKQVGSTVLTNPYRNEGWIKLVSDYNTKKYTSGGSAQDYSNLYEGKLVDGTSSGKDIDVKITEQEVIKLITTTLKDIEKIDNTEFKKHIGIGVPTGVTINWKKTNTSITATAATVGGWLDTLQNHAKNLVNIHGSGGKEKETGREEWSLGHNFVKTDNSGMCDTPFNEASIEVFFDLMNFLCSNYQWMEHNDVKSKVLKNIESNQELTIIPAQSTPYNEGKLHSWGMEGYLADNFKNSANLTKFYGDIPKKDWEDKAIKFEVKEGMRGRAIMINHFFQVYFNSGNGRKEKLISSFETIDPTTATTSTTKNNPYPALLHDYQAVDKFGSLSYNGNNYTLQEFPKFFYERQKDLYRLKGLRDSELKRLDTGGEELNQCQQELDQAKANLKAGEKLIEDRIDEVKKEIREELKTKCGIDATTYKGFKKTSTEDNRVTFLDIVNLQLHLKNLRYLENGSEEAISSVGNENTALTDLEKLWDDCHPIITDSDPIRKKIAYVISFMRSGSQTNEERINERKKFVEGKWQSHTWKDIVDGFDELEKLIKLPDGHPEAKKAVEEYMNKPDTTEKLSEWQSKLKKLDPLLTESIVNEDKMKDFQKHTNFKKISEVEGLIRKVLDEEGTAPNITYKLKADFATVLTKEDADMKNIADMFTKLDAEKMIKIIHLFEYNNLLKESQKQEIRRLYSWDRNKKVDGKYVGDNEDFTEITEEDKKLGGDFTKFLYELTTGVKSKTSIAKPSEQSDDNGNNAPSEEKGHFAKYWYWYVGTGLVVAALLGAAIYFWDDISKKLGWTKPEDDGEESD